MSWVVDTCVLIDVLEADPEFAQASLAAHRAGSLHIQRRRHSTSPKRPIAEVLIGALATRHSGLLTRNPADFHTLFPSLPLRTP